jgi:hypothetical protein
VKQLALFGIGVPECDFSSTHATGIGIFVVEPGVQSILVRCLDGYGYKLKPLIR